MTSWIGKKDARAREPVQLGLIDSVVVMLLPWLAPEGEFVTDGPCVREPEAGS